MASEIPLVLYDCVFEDLHFDIDEGNDLNRVYLFPALQYHLFLDLQRKTLSLFIDQLEQFHVKTAMTLAAIESLQSSFVPCPEELHSNFDGDQYIRFDQLCAARRPNKASHEKYLPLDRLPKVGDGGSSKGKK